VYTFMTLAAFTVVAAVSGGERGRGEIDDLAGLHATSPFLAAAMALAMLSLAGIPPTGGFVAKFNLFAAAVKSSNESGDPSLIWLAILGVINSALSLAYYLRVPVVMYMRDLRSDGAARAHSGAFGALVLAVCGAGILLLGLMPSHFAVGSGEVSPLGSALAGALALLR
jgi:NADH-quinone oxidoreductase subunit N